ncbi:MAG: hypothetical protein AAGA21_09985 [Pseudomonadota bacterium]
MPHRLLPITVCSLLVACAEAPSPESEPNDFGLAVRSNMNAQIIAKEGEVTTLGPAPGVRRSLAAARYQTDQVEQPVKIFTRSGSE